ncbi:MAG: GPW/gp25 family protein [Hydrogenophaga sp.]|uniref:GPW/gp25 family protein n=1 Tax=Hydrogenophaga sp. TaxID=1904254 RepID=UPI002721929A|nr:GPW/gp25 family protein [Hydrogenophaga sp.]MDO9571175.1 GPW/gp25 family protein [Hydrogenophaga sp.]
MHRTTGQAVDGLDHLNQSIVDILTTPLGSRVMRRDYGSLLPELIDQPDNGATRLRVYAATASALMRWEPRLRLIRVALQTGVRHGQVVLDIDGFYATPAGDQPVGLQVDLSNTAAA